MKADGAVLRADVQAPSVRRVARSLLAGWNACGRAAATRRQVSRYVVRCSLLGPAFAAAVVVPDAASATGTALASTSAPASSIPASAERGPVDVLYAGSLVRLMTRGIAPAFRRATGDTLDGLPGGSKGLALQIRDGLRTPDVFVSANPAVNDLLDGDARHSGAGSPTLVRWFVTFARSPLLIGFLPDGRFARLLKGHRPIDVLAEPGIRIGRTDPRLDPKGALTLRLVQQEADAIGRPDLAGRILGAPENPSQVFPEEDLVGRLESGQVDVGFFYSTEIADLRLASVAPPAAHGLGAVYTATVLADAPNPARGARFIAFLLGDAGEAVLRRHGLDLVRPTVTGDATALPPAVAEAVSDWTPPALATDGGAKGGDRPAP